jgi:uncharacterized protein (TIGR00251 family)
MIAVSEHPEGCVLPVRVQPGARRTGVQGEQAGALKVAVAAPPQDGRANKALIETLGDALGVRRSQIVLLSGQTRRDKRILVRGVTTTELNARIAAAFARWLRR